MTEPGGDGVKDGVWRHDNGTLTIACTISMPGVKASMWDWWFGWHSLSSVRYRLWHPEAHKRSRLAEDRRALPVGRPRYVGNVSAVDEWIGPRMSRLAIGFVRPAKIGLDEALVDAMGTAVCAEVSLRKQRICNGQLVHLLQDGAEGCTMHSRFHLGDLQSLLPVVGPFVTVALNRPSTRRRLLDDALGLALLRHCFEEMHHLAAILPGLHAEFGRE